MRENHFSYNGKVRVRYLLDVGDGVGAFVLIPLSLLPLVPSFPHQGWPLSLAEILACFWWISGSGS